MTPERQIRFISPSGSVPAVRMSLTNYLVMVGWIVIAHAYELEDIPPIPFLMPTRSVVLINLNEETAS